MGDENGCVDGSQLDNAPPPQAGEAGGGKQLVRLVND